MGIIIYKKICNKCKVNFISCEDILLNPIKSILTDQEQVYTKFTPYFNKAKSTKVKNVIKNSMMNYISNKSKFDNEFRKSIHIFYKKNNELAVRGGRSNGVKILNNMDDFTKYNKERNILNLSTTRLSAYNKFGCVSIREVYWKIKDVLGNKNDLIKQLYWRDFYYNVMAEYPYVMASSNKNFRQKYKKVPWKTWRNAKSKKKTTDLELWYNWCDGMTGYPVVDACMREMNVTGFMHNRGRLIVSNFLSKLMMWNWTDGEEYFAQKLVDYDPAVNNGNHQWSAGSGVDAQPYFRIFNPWTQGEKFDPNCEYIKKWVPELKNVDNSHIHQWNDYCDKYDIDYPDPMIEYEKSRKVALEKFKKALH